jgi:hypothetical protein
MVMFFTFRGLSGRYDPNAFSTLGVDDDKDHSIDHANYFETIFTVIHRLIEDM